MAMLGPIGLGIVAKPAISFLKIIWNCIDNVLPDFQTILPFLVRCFLCLDIGRSFGSLFLKISRLYYKVFTFLICRIKENTNVARIVAQKI
jgi:hypothetical protein